MKAEAWIFGGLTIFFALVTPAYALITLEDGVPEITGTAALILTFFLTLMIWVFFGIIAKRIDPRPEDKQDGRDRRRRRRARLLPAAEHLAAVRRADLRPGRPRPGLRLVAD